MENQSSIPDDDIDVRRVDGPTETPIMVHLASSDDPWIWLDDAEAESLYTKLGAVLGKNPTGRATLRYMETTYGVTPPAEGFPPLKVLKPKKFDPDSLKICRPEDVFREVSEDDRTVVEKQYVWVVMDGTDSYGPATINSIWTTEAQAQAVVEKDKINCGSMSSYLDVWKWELDSDDAQGE